MKKNLLQPMDITDNKITKSTYVLECYVSSLALINNGRFRFDYKERKERKRKRTSYTSLKENQEI